MDSVYMVNRFMACTALINPVPNPDQNLFPGFSDIMNNPVFVDRKAVFS